ncbi:MAG: hypothetical protein IIB64_02190 [Proteobacteria bacterium]|nr:hypothetical protein [Pseudomonadota bacterium]
MRDYSNLFGLISLIAYIISPVLYWDATKNKIGKIKGEKGFLNMHAGGWAFLALWTFLFIGPITWVVYLVKRRNLIAKAKNHPVGLTSSHRILVVFFWSAAP